tara:strand:+ start:138 stop:395 length:258 start_codon:yes stop_codon:yes gene_type:complete
MNQFIKLEKRFENAFARLEQALANINISNVSNSVDIKENVLKENNHNYNDLLVKIEHLEKAAKDDAKQIDSLVMRLKEVLEINND